VDIEHCDLMPRADALSSKRRRETFQDEFAMVMTASLRSPTIDGCALAAA